MNIPLVWSAREVPLQAEAAVARGEVATRLAHRLLALDDAQLARLRGAAANGLLAIVGDSNDLPWVDGILYLGREGDAAELYVSTTSASDIPIALIARAIARTYASLPPPRALIETNVISLAAVGPIDRAMLARWVEAQS